MKVKDIFTVPTGQKVVSMVRYKDHIVLATEYVVYQIDIIDDEATIQQLRLKESNES